MTATSATEANRVGSVRTVSRPGPPSPPAMAAGPDDQAAHPTDSPLARGSDQTPAISRVSAGRRSSAAASRRTWSASVVPKKGTGAAWRPSCSERMLTSTMPSPRPPSASGCSMASQPWSASTAHRSRSNPPAGGALSGIPTKARTCELEA